MRQVLGASALGRPRGMGWRGRWEGGSGWGTHVNPWLIHVIVWQKPPQYCKVISLQLKKMEARLSEWLGKPWKKKYDLNAGEPDPTEFFSWKFGCLWKKVDKVIFPLALLFLLSTLSGFRDLCSPARDRNGAPCSGSTGSQTLGHSGSPSTSFNVKNYEQGHHSGYQNHLRKLGLIKQRKWLEVNSVGAWNVTKLRIFPSFFSNLSVILHLKQNDSPGRQLQGQGGWRWEQLGARVQSSSERVQTRGPWVLPRPPPAWRRLQKTAQKKTPGFVPVSGAPGAAEQHRCLHLKPRQHISSSVYLLIVFGEELAVWKRNGCSKGCTNAWRPS